MFSMCPLDKNLVENDPSMVVVANPTELCHYDLKSGEVVKSAKFAFGGFSIVSRVSGTSYFIVKENQQTKFMVWRLGERREHGFRHFCEF